MLPAFRKMFELNPLTHPLNTDSPACMVFVYRDTGLSTINLIDWGLCVLHLWPPMGSITVPVFLTTNSFHNKTHTTAHS